MNEENKMTTINKAINNADTKSYRVCKMTAGCNADIGVLYSYTGVCWLQENVFSTYFPNVLLDLAAAFAAMVLVDSNKEVVGATGHISTRPVPR